MFNCKTILICPETKFNVFTGSNAPRTIHTTAAFNVRDDRDLAQIYQRIEAIYPGQLEVTDFFDYPTIAELARYLESRLKSAQA